MKTIHIVGAVGIVAGILAAASLAPFTIIQSGEVGVIKTFGSVTPETLTEGFHVVNPLASIHNFNIRLQKADASGTGISRDLQQVTSKFVVNYHLDAKNAAIYYQKVGGNAEAVLIEPAMQESLKAVTAKYSAEELIGKREEVRTAIKALLSTRLKERSFGGLVVDDFAISEFTFSPQFTKAVESKMEAEQLALKAANDLRRIEIEAKGKIANAQAEAEGLRLQKSEITPQLVDLRRIEVEREAIRKWDGKLPNMMSGAMPFVNVGK